MYFDQNVLRILYSISDDLDITDVEDIYIANCLEAALEALIVFKAMDTKISDEFLEDSVKFEDLFNSNSEEYDLDLGFAQEILDRLRENKEFNEIFQGYLDVINEKIYNEAVSKNPDVIIDLQEYLERVQDSFIAEYFQRFVNSIVEMDEESNSEEE